MSTDTFVTTSVYIYISFDCYTNVIYKCIIYFSKQYGFLNQMVCKSTYGAISFATSLHDRNNMGQSQNRCSMVSQVALQNWHLSESFILHMYKNLLVTSILWSIRYRNDLKTALFLYSMLLHGIASIYCCLSFYQGIVTICHVLFCSTGILSSKTTYTY